ncbi:hypothetical protein BpHYR1_021765 [Brachionus plicatilis]|uniref:Uncharacterized protein n=1 Tax=Brachionus plicatilis TaxID=10195 RepID=A0A3M7QWR8_BRAPC|nr:hypothetical protein BpHYR1_021765 [Brachionus plicatilis]
MINSFIHLQRQLMIRDRNHESSDFPTNSFNTILNQKIMRNKINSHINSKKLSKINETNLLQFKTLNIQNSFIFIRRSFFSNRYIYLIKLKPNAQNKILDLIKNSRNYIAKYIY